MNEYRTVGAAACAEFSEKRSRFIGHAAPVSDETGAAAFIAEIKSKHWDARHNVYAYSLREGQLRRYSDDKEPKGTAGVPMLDVLIKEELVDCVVVVTRYFGGVLLGTGGLVRAYSHAAKIAVDAAGIVTMKKCSLCRIACDYNQYSRAEALLKSRECAVRDTVFEADVKIEFLMAQTAVSAFREELADLFCGSVVLKVIGEEFAPFY